MCGLRCSLVRSVWADRHRTQKRRILISQNLPTPSLTDVIALSMEVVRFERCSWCLSFGYFIYAFFIQFWSFRFGSLDEGKPIVFYVHELLYGYDSTLTSVATYASG